MHRSTVAAIVVTALFGATGGAVTALVRGSESSPEKGAVSAPSSPTADGTGTPGTPVTARLLYAAGGTIHDGSTTVHFRAPFDTPDRLVRAGDGWLLSHGTSPQEPAFDLYYVRRDGSTGKIASIFGDFWVDSTGLRLVAPDLRSGKLTQYGLDGSVLAVWSGRPGQMYAGWAGEVVYVSENLDGYWRLFRWTPATGKNERLDDVGYSDMQVAHDGTLLAGRVGHEGASVDPLSDSDSNACLAVGSTPGRPHPDWWFTCDWRPNGGSSDVFSPQDNSVLAVPSQTDGFGPGQLATFSARTGPAEGVRKFITPQWTTDARWLDEAHLVVTSRTDGEATAKTGTVLRSCTLEGACTVVARRPDGPIAVGEQS